MADPFSIVGSAVGVISLGITGCKDLVWYISNATDAKEKTDDIASRLNSLVDALDIIQKVVEGLGSSPCASAANSTIDTCTAAVTRIRKKLGQPTSDPTQPRSFRASLKKLRHCLIYPFKQDELAYWKNVLEGLQQDLQLVLLALQLEQQRLQSESEMSQLNENSRLSQLGFEATAERQMHLHAETMSQLKDQTSIIRSGQLASENQFHEMQQNVNNFQLSISTVATDVSAMSVTLPQLVSSMQALEAKLKGIVLQPSSSTEYLLMNESNDRSRSRYQKRINRKPRQTLSRCHCIAQTKTIIYLRRPMRVERTVRIAHEQNCPQAVQDGTVSDADLAVSICAPALRRKVQISLNYSRRVGTSSISPSLIYHRVVPYESPAFMLFSKTVLRIDSRCEEEATKNFSSFTAELLQLFQDGKASPYDRVPNGQSLLHYYCDNAWQLSWYAHSQKALNIYASVGLQLMEHVGDLAFEKDDSGRTCLDYIAHSYHRNNLCRGLQQRGVPVSISSFIDSHHLHTHIYNDPENLIADSELVKVIVVRSEMELERLLSDPKTLSVIDGSKGLELYILATRLGWVRGCEILWSHRVPLARAGTPGFYANRHQNLLREAISAEDRDTLKFWLGLRHKLTEEQLCPVGALEDVLEWYPPELSDPVFDAIIQQRKSLKQIAILHLEPHQYTGCGEELIDADAFRVLDMLAEKDVDVHPTLRPAQKSIWYSRTLWEPSAVVADRLYDAGFRDITSAQFEDSVITPLLAQVNYKIARLDEDACEHLSRKVKWFLSKGASLYETWPGSDNTTALHCLAWSIGDYLRDSLIYERWFNVEHFENQFSLGKLDELVSNDQCSDGCTCRCSTSGCIPITVFGKGFLKPRRGETLYMSLPWICSVMDERAALEKNNWIASEFIRIAVFSALEIRHTCCDLERIRYWGPDDVDSTRSPIPRYPPEETARILEEDSHLLVLLEQLVVEFGKQFDEAQLSLPQFFDDVFIPKMDEVLRDLAKEDEALYGEGRRELGVVMEPFQVEGFDDDSTYKHDDEGSEDGDRGTKV